MKYGEYLKFLGLTSRFKFLTDFKFYIVIIGAQFFFIVISIFVKTTAHINNIPYFFITQIYIAATEELLFRGIILGFLKKYIYSSNFGISSANILTAVIFSGFHLLNHPLLWALGTFFPALIFGYFREKYSLWPAIFLHFIYNSEYFLFF